MNNYFGIGLDADITLEFHNKREDKPEKFNSRLHNKGVYFKVGVGKLVGRKMCKNMHKEIRLEVDGKPIELPTLEGIIILNIMRWVGKDFFVAHINGSLTGFPFQLGCWRQRVGPRTGRQVYEPQPLGWDSRGCRCHWRRAFRPDSVGTAVGRSPSSGEFEWNVDCSNSPLD